MEDMKVKLNSVENKLGVIVKDIVKLEAEVKEIRLAPRWYVGGTVMDKDTFEPVVGASCELTPILHKYDFSCVEYLWYKVNTSTSGLFIFDRDPITGELYPEIPEGEYTLIIDPRFPDDHEGVELKVSVPNGSDVGVVKLHSPTYKPEPAEPVGDVRIVGVEYRRKGATKWQWWINGTEFSMADLHENRLGQFGIISRLQAVNESGEPVLVQLKIHNQGKQMVTETYEGRPIQWSGTGSRMETPIDWQMKNRAEENLMYDSKVFMFMAKWQNEIAEGDMKLKLELIEWKSGTVLDSREFKYVLEG